MTADTSASTVARIRPRGQVTLPAEVLGALHVGEGDELEFTRHEDGTVTVRGLKTIPADQAWFWTPEWQEGELEAKAQIARGELSEVFDSADEMFDDLDKQA
jgi:antitoxin PrlF